MTDIVGSPILTTIYPETTTWSCAIPAGAVGATQLLVLGYRSTYYQPTTPAGWDLLFSAEHSSLGGVRVFRRVLASAFSAANISVGFSGSTKGEAFAASFDGVVDVVSSANEITWSTPGAQFTSVDPPALTASAANSVYVAVVLSPEYPRNITVAAPSLVLTADRVNPQEQPAVNVAKKAVGAGSVTPNTISFVAPYGGDASAESLTFSLILKPSGGSPSPTPTPTPSPAPAPSGSSYGPPVLATSPAASTCTSEGFGSIAKGSALADNNTWAFGEYGLELGVNGVYQTLCLGDQLNGANTFRIQANIPKGITPREVRSYPAIYWGQVPGFAGYARLPHPNLPILVNQINVCWAGWKSLTDASSNSPFGHLAHDMRLVDTSQDIDGYYNAEPHIKLEMFVVVKQWGGYGAHPSGRDPSWYHGMYSIGGRNWHVYLQHGASNAGATPQLIWIPDSFAAVEAIDLAPLFKWGTQTRYQDLLQNAGTAIREPGKAASDYIMDPSYWFTHNAMGIEVIDGTFDVTDSTAFFRVNQDTASDGTGGGGGGGGATAPSAIIQNGLTYASFANAATASVPRIAPTAVGQTMLEVLVINNSSSSSVNDIADRPLVLASDLDQYNNRLYVFEKVATSADVSAGAQTLTRTFSAAATGLYACLIISGTRIAAARNGATQGNFVRTVTSPTLTPTAQDQFLLSIVGSGNWERTQQPTSPMIEVLDVQQTVDSSSGVSLAIGYMVVSPTSYSVAAWTPDDPGPGTDGGDFFRSASVLFGAGASVPPTQVDGASVSATGDVEFVVKPTNLTVVPAGADGFAATWDDQTPDETEFVIEYYAAGAPSTIYSSVAANVTTETVTGLTLGAIYYVRVFARRGYGESAATPWVQAAIAPGAFGLNLSASLIYVVDQQTTLITASTNPPAANKPVAWTLTPPNVMTVDSIDVYTDANGRAYMTLRGTPFSGAGTIKAVIEGQQRTIVVTNTAVVETLSLEVTPSQLEPGLQARAVVTGTASGVTLQGRTVSIVSSDQGVILTTSSATIQRALDGGYEARFSLPVISSGSTTLIAYSGADQSNAVQVLAVTPAPPVNASATGVSRVTITADTLFAYARKPRVRRQTNADHIFKHPTDTGMSMADEISKGQYVFFRKALLRGK